MVDARRIECLWHVRYYRNNVAGLPSICLWNEKRLDTLGMAGIQSNFLNGVFGNLASPFGRDDRRSMDRNKIRER